MVIVVADCCGQNLFGCVLFHNKAVKVFFNIPGKIIKLEIKGSIFGFGALIGGAGLVGFGAQYSQLTLSPYLLEKKSSMSFRNSSGFGHLVPEILDNQYLPDRIS